MGTRPRTAEEEPDGVYMNQTQTGACVDATGFVSPVVPCGDSDSFPLVPLLHAAVLLLG